MKPRTKTRPRKTIFGADWRDTHPISYKELLEYTLTSAFQSLSRPLCASYNPVTGAVIAQNAPDYITNYNWIMSREIECFTDYESICCLYDYHAEAGRALARHIHLQRQQIIDQVRAGQHHQLIRWQSSRTGYLYPAMVNPDFQTVFYRRDLATSHRYATKHNYKPRARTGRSRTHRDARPNL